MKYFDPTFSHVTIPIGDENSVERWRERVCKTRHKLFDLFDSLSTNKDSIPDSNKLADRVYGIKDQVGLYTVKSLANSNIHLTKQGGRSRSCFGTHVWVWREIKGIPNYVWLKEQWVAVLPSSHTIQWLNELADSVTV